MLHEDLTITAHLAQLPITDEELAAAEPAFLAMLDNFSRMSALDVDSLEPTNHAYSSRNRVRDDFIYFDTNDLNPFNPANNLLGMAAERDGRFIVIPNVL
jgi:aspartyl/glutamyl-tRNA(Asn/Gln) amidotransferase C subunit